VRRLLPGLLAVGVIAGLAGCGERDGAAAPSPARPASSASATATSVTGDAAADVETAVREAEALLSSIDAELAADATETD
jgi:hypothetical protein